MDRKTVRGLSRSGASYDSHGHTSNNNLYYEYIPTYKKKKIITKQSIDYLPIP